MLLRVAYNPDAGLTFRPLTLVLMAINHLLVRGPKLEDYPLRREAKSDVIHVFILARDILADSLLPAPAMLFAFSA